ncbi:MAG: hypothetical protein HC861_02850 [Rhodospirillaceae bacterium]|nr:hypothetical protein [Rhodospirillaceae bacterium]
MWEFRHKVRTLFPASSRAIQSGRRAGPDRAADWLPPVLGPNDWSVGIMADRSASWYFDRDQA